MEVVEVEYGVANRVNYVAKNKRKADSLIRYTHREGERERGTYIHI